MHCRNQARSLLILLFAFLLALAMPVAAQFTTATLTGTVSDSSGAVVPDAKVVVTNTETGFAQTVQTGADGSYLFPRLPVGKYSLSVDKPGFNPFAQTGITLTVSRTVTQDVSLQVGGTASAVEVTAEAPLVTTGTAQVGHLVDQKRIVDLPLNGRNAQALVFLAPGAVDVTSRYCGYNCMGGVYPSEQQAAVNGAGPGQVNYQLDGVNHNDTFLNMNLPFPNPDSVQEFSLQTNSLSAEYGSSASGAVNIVTKSGTNELHGSLFHFLRNGSVNARNFFAPESDTLKRNQFGGSIGGPIAKNRLFFFGTYQGTRAQYASKSALAYVPTAAQRAGDFSSISKQLVDPVTKAPYPNNQVPTNQFNPVSRYLLDRIPLPNGAGRELRYTAPLSKQTENQYLGKIDWNRDNHQVSGRYFFSQFTQPATTPEDNLLAADGNGNRVRVQNYGVTHTWALSPTTLANTSFGYSRQGGGNFSSAPWGLPQAGQKVATPDQPEIAVFVGNAFQIFTNHKGAFNRADANFRENVTLIRGKHELHLGTDITRVSNYLDNQFLQSGQFYFENNITGDNILDFMLGRVGWFSQGGGERKNMTGYRYGFFVQDNWRATPRLTVNAGLRWDPFIPYSERDGRTACFIPGAKSSRYPNAPTGLVYGGEGGCPKNAVDSYLPAFGPRLGFAYRLTEDGKTSLRGGAGIYYSAAATNFMLYHYNAPFAPWYGFPNTDFTDPWGAAGRTNPYPGMYASNVPGSDVAFSTPVSLKVVDRDWQPSYVTSWNLTLERQFTDTVLIRGAYVGNKGTHLSNTVGWPAQRNINAPIYTPGGDHWNYDSRRPHKGFGGIEVLESSITSNYHSFQATVEKRMSKGFSLVGNYTWGRAQDDYNWMNPFDRGFNWGISDDNIPHNFKMSSIWELPSSKWTGPLGAVVNGWSLNTIVNWRSGFPFGLYSGNDNSWTGIWGDRADYLGGDWKLSGDRPHGELIKKYFDGTPFKTAAEGTFGNTPKNFMTGPRFFSTDMVLTKTFKVVERAALNFRAEAFNVFNNVNFNRPGNNVDAPARFGKIEGAQDPRILQFALKLTF
jgi:hypothetical protein